MSATVTASGLVRDLAAISGEAHLTDIPAELQSFAIDGIVPRVAVAPATPEEVAAILQLCAARDLVVAPAGGFTAQVTGRIPPRVDVLLRTVRLKSLEHYDPGDLTIGVGAGVTIAELQQKLRGNNQIVPISVPGADRATIGGVLARAAHGPLKHGYGGVRDYCIGIRFATADGKLAKGGGRVVKNVAGFDLMKLIIGSYGTLGVIVSASFKVFPRPRQTRTFIAGFGTLDATVEFRDRILNSALSPLCLELVSPSAAALLQIDDRGRGWRLLICAAGSDIVLARYGRELGTAVGLSLEGQQEALLWQRIVNFSELCFERSPGALLLSVSLPLASLVQVVNACQQAAAANGFACAAVGRAGVGSMLFAFLPVSTCEPAAYSRAVSAVRAAVPRDVSVSVLRCPREAKPGLDPWGASPTDLECLRAVKRALDPKDILNRGRFLF